MAWNFHPQVAGVNGHGDRQPIRWKIWSESGILRAFHSTRLGHSPYSCFSSLHFIFRREGVRFTSIHVYIYTHTCTRARIFPSEAAPWKIRCKHPRANNHVHSAYRPSFLLFFTPFLLSLSLSFPFEGKRDREGLRGAFPREAIKWHFPLANINWFAVDRANIRSVGPRKRARERERERRGAALERICGLRPWEYYGFKVSRGSHGVTRDISRVIFPYSDIE